MKFSTHPVFNDLLSHFTRFGKASSLLRLLWLTRRIDNNANTKFNLVISEESSQRTRSSWWRSLTPLFAVYRVKQRINYSFDAANFQSVFSGKTRVECLSTLPGALTVCVLGYEERQLVPKARFTCYLFKYNTLASEKSDILLDYNTDNLYTSIQLS